MVGVVWDQREQSVRRPGYVLSLTVCSEQVNERFGLSA